MKQPRSETSHPAPHPLRAYVARSALLAWLLCLACLALPTRAQQEAPPPPTGTTTVLKVVARRVTVDVVVTGTNGQPISGLTGNDFKVFEDGKQQALRSFDAHVLKHFAAPPPPKLDLPPHTFANLVQAPQDSPVTVILYDVLNTPTQAMPYAHEAMVKFIKNQPPGSRTAIFVLSSKLRMLQGFTDDETRLISAINSKSSATQQSSLLLNSANTGITTPDPTNDNPPAPNADPNAAGPANILGQLNDMEAMENIMMLRERLEATVDAFAEIARFLSALPGRKNLLWLSGSFPGSIIPEADPAVSGTSNEFGLTFDSAREIKIANDLLNAAHVAVYPVDVRGLQTDPIFSASSNAKVTASSPPKSTFNNQQNAEHGTMDEIADNTGGHAFYNTNGLIQAMQQAIDQGSVYYTLTYSPSNGDFDGHMRKIHVELDKPGYQLSYRKSYFADDANPGAAAPASAAADAATPANPVTRSMQHGAPIATELFFESTVLPVEGLMPASPRETAQLSQFAAGPTKKKPLPQGPLMVQHYQVTLSILGRLLSMPAIDAARFDLHLTLAVAGFDADGLLLNGLEIEVKDPLSTAERDKIRSSAYRTKLNVALPPDARWLRIAVCDANGNHTGSIEVPIGETAASR